MPPFSNIDKGHTQMEYPFVHIPELCSKNQSRIQDFPQGGAPTPKIAIIFQSFAENCMKMKEFGPLGGASLAPPLRSANANI